MAIKTLRLYPTAHRGLDTQSYYPEDTLKENLHLLIAESIPDDDTSYIVVSYLNIVNQIGISYSVPLNLTPLAIRVVYRAKSNNNSVLTVQATVPNPNSSGENKLGVIALGEVTLTSTYETYIAEVPLESITLVYNYMITNDFSASSQIGFGASVQSAKNSADARVTQTYLEIDYEAAEDASLPQEIYIKENGAWIEKQVYIYQKLNGAWEPADKSVLGSVKYVIDTTTQEGG